MCNDSVYVADLDSIFNCLLLDHCIQAVYNNMSGSAFRRNNMARLHVFPGEEVETFLNLMPKYVLRDTFQTSI